MLMPGVDRGEVIPRKLQGANRKQMLCVTGKLSCWGRTAICLVGVLFLRVTQQQMMRKEKKKKTATYEMYLHSGRVAKQKIEHSFSAVSEITDLSGYQYIAFLLCHIF